MVLDDAALLTCTYTGALRPLQEEEAQESTDAASVKRLKDQLEVIGCSWCQS